MAAATARALEKPSRTARREPSGWARFLFSFPPPPARTGVTAVTSGKVTLGSSGLLVSRILGQLRGEAEPEWVRPSVVARASGRDKTEGYGPPVGVTPHPREREQRERMRNGEEEK